MILNGLPWKRTETILCFWDCIQVLHFGLSCWLWWLLHFFKGFLLTVVDIMSSELNSPIPVHFSSLIPRMSTFTLTISCLTTSNLPWFVDLTFQVSMQYCSLQHWTLLPSPVTSTTGCCLCFGSISHSFWSYFSTDLQSASLTTINTLIVWITRNCGKFLKRWEYQTTLPVSWGTCMQVKKQ